jgi:hypothetical protein
LAEAGLGGIGAALPLYFADGNAHPLGGIYDHISAGEGEQFRAADLLTRKGDALALDSPITELNDEASLIGRVCIGQTRQAQQTQQHKKET